jgi:hypothetical protein
MKHVMVKDAVPTFTEEREMNRLDSLISGTVAISLLLFSLSTQGADSPQATIQAAVQKTLTALRDPANEGPAHREDRLAKAEG